MMLYRPCGNEEMALVFEAQMMAWPPRLPDQPIFYPVTNMAYAAQISRDWNTTSGTGLGWVTSFEIDDAYASRFERQIVGGAEHEELWVPAEQLDEFNAHIHAPIQVHQLFARPGVAGFIPPSGPTRGMSHEEQLAWLGVHASSEDLGAFIAQQPQSIWLNWPLWRARGEHVPTLDLLRSLWTTHSRIALPEFDVIVHGR